MISTEAATRAAGVTADHSGEDGPAVRAGAPAHLAGVVALVDDRLDRLFTAEQARWGCVDADLRPPLSALAAFCRDGGKRLRPAFCYWAFVGAGGRADDRRLADACAALELLHAFALIHDDVMDGSTTRRNHETVHVRFAGMHRAGDWRGEARRFGEGVAVLLGDLAFVYADQLMERMPPEVTRLYTELRLELTMGQYLDLLGAARGEVDEVVARRIGWYKSAKYTVERPLHLGAALAGQLGELGGPLSAVGLPLGEAFQLRDDLLGVFGDQALTGKPVGDDLREGKPTPLLALATERIRQHGPRAAAAVLARVGDPELAAADIDDIRSVLESSGARAEVEARIQLLVAQSSEALGRAALSLEARAALGELATFVAARRA